MQRRHERKKEKRKKSVRLQGQVQAQGLDPGPSQGGPMDQAEDTRIQPQPREIPVAQRETPQKETPQKTVIKAEPKTPKVRDVLSILHSMCLSTT